mgnify:CR=1 FL=1|tara:strand:- start:883 stop:1158 length:276 start_codon:yes stop_codon:yes gene_type:complete
MIPKYQQPKYPQIKVNHNLYDLLGSELANLIDTGKFDPDHMRDVLNYHAAGNLNVDFGDGYELDFGINQSNPNISGDKFKYKLGVKVPFEL